MLMIIIWFWVDAHKWFKGPKINISVSQIARSFKGREVANKRTSITCSSVRSKALQYPRGKISIRRAARSASLYQHKKERKNTHQ